MARRLERSFGGLVGWLGALAAAPTILVIIALAGPVEAETACGSIQQRVDAAAAGATVDLPDGCVYREDVTIDKPLTLRGGPGVEIRGSDVWTGWTKSGPYWVRGGLPAFEPITQISDPQHPYPCQDGTSRCRWPEQVFLDGEPLTQVASDPSSGQFAVDANRNVILADDPTGRRVEVSVRQYWVKGRAPSVTIEGFAMKHAANGLQSAALSNNGYGDWTVRNNDLSYAHDSILALNDATGLRIENNDIHHGGRIGATSVRSDIEVVNNEIHHNNTEDFYSGWTAGGMKFSNAVRAVVDGNEVHHNDWSGVWADSSSQNVVYSNNRVHHNLKRGLHLEIADHAEVFGNVVWENGWGAPGADGAGISATASRDVEIYDNTLAWNSAGIAIVNSQRENGVGGSDPVFDTVSDVHVHHNTILAEPEASGGRLALVWRKTYAGGNIYDPAANNRGYDNRYWYHTPEGFQNRFVWEGSFDRIGGFNATLGEERGRYLSASEKDAVVAAEGIPADPERAVDTTAPATPEITGPAADGYKKVRAFTVSGTAEANSKIKLFDGGTLVGAAETDAAGGWSRDLSGVTEGSHAYTATATDVLGNASEPSAARTMTVDTLEPDTRIDSGPAGAEQSTAPSFGFSSNEPGVTFECSLGSASFAACASPKGYADLAEGQYTFRVRAVDRAGNVDPSPAGRTWAVDATAPWAPGIAGPAENSYNPGRFTVSGIAEANSVVRLFDGGTLVGTTEASRGGGWSRDLSGVAEGTHAYTATSTDAAGNVSAASGARTVKVDTTAPETVAPVEGLVPNSTLGQADAPANVPVRLDWSGSDAGSGVARYELEHSVDGGPYSPVALPKQKATTFTLPLEPGKTHRFRVRAVDAVGNVGPWTAGKDFTLTVYQENAVGYPAGSWTDAALAGAYGGHLKYAGAPGARTSLTFRGRDVAWVSWKAQNRGKAEVFVDGAKAAAPSLYSAAEQPRRVVFRKPDLAPSVQHTIEVRAAGTGRVDVDAFVVLN